MMTTRTALQAIVNKTLRAAHCNVSCPVTVSSRFTRTLGQASFLGYGKTIVSVVGIKFSANLLAVATDKCIMDVILHECAHVIANTRKGTDQGHNAYFKAVCHEIGTTNDKTYTTMEYKANYKPEAKATVKVAATVAHHRYEVVCPCCGVIAHFDRKCKTIDNIERYRCTKCGNTNLKVQRW